MEAREVNMHHRLIKKATLMGDNKNTKVIVVLFDDGTVGVCGSSTGNYKNAICYISSKPEGEKLYYMAIAFYDSLGNRILEEVENI